MHTAVGRLFSDIGIKVAHTGPAQATCIGQGKRVLRVDLLGGIEVWDNVEVAVVEGDVPGGTLGESPVQGIFYPGSGLQGQLAELVPIAGIGRENVLLVVQVVYVGIVNEPRILGVVP